MTNAMKFIINTADDKPFDYKEELTSEQYNDEYTSKLMKIFTSDGNEENQQAMWSQHILDTYEQAIIAHDAKLLASDKDFLGNFTENADKHRKMVCQYCGSITSSINYFDI